MQFFRFIFEGQRKIFISLNKLIFFFNFFVFQHKKNRLSEKMNIEQSITSNHASDGSSDSFKNNRCFLCNIKKYGNVKRKN